MSARTFAVVLAAFTVFGCDLLKPPPPKPFEARVKVFGEPGQPLKGAEVWYKQKKIGVTDDAGVVNFRLKGAEGEVYDLTLKCPTGFQSPPKPVSVTLRKTADPSQRPEYQVDCPKATRSVVVAVRADSGPNLPVMYLGREVARTDVSGAAHVYLDMPPNQMFQLLLSTDADTAKDLRPQNPAATFEVKHSDDVFVFDQKFKIEKKRVIRGGGHKKPSGPTPI
ncbi:MAG: hypothetical protein IPI67_20090 [Myxococcales bacterium]|nr:hypothetical protein [Myxococcales bacterium]